MKNKCLSEVEEIKVSRLSILLNFLDKEEAINFVAPIGPFRFTATTGIWSDKLTDRPVAPTEEMIDLFYKRLCRDAHAKLEADLRRSQIKGLRKLLVRYFELDFLPLAY